MQVLTEASENLCLGVGYFVQYIACELAYHQFPILELYQIGILKGSIKRKLHTHYLIQSNLVKYRYLLYIHRVFPIIRFFY